jgi:hypothetical protein
MTEQEYKALREASWRRSLDAAEDARVRAHLGANSAGQRDWELDAELTQLLAQVPNAPVPSNFTHQVLAALDRETRLAVPRPLGAWWPRWLLRPLPRLAGGLALLAALGSLGYHQYQTYRQAELTQALLQVTHASGLKQAGIFQDFDVIQRLGQVPQPADEELWLVLNQAQPK